MQAGLVLDSMELRECKNDSLCALGDYDNKSVLWIKQLFLLMLPGSLLPPFLRKEPEVTDTTNSSMDHFEYHIEHIRNSGGNNISTGLKIGPRNEIP